MRRAAAPQDTEDEFDNISSETLEQELADDLRTIEKMEAIVASMQPVTESGAAKLKKARRDIRRIKKEIQELKRSSLTAN